MSDDDVSDELVAELSQQLGTMRGRALNEDEIANVRQFLRILRQKLDDYHLRLITGLTQEQIDEYPFAPGISLDDIVKYADPNEA